MKRAGAITSMNAETGKPLSGMDHLRQSIIDILTTRIGSRVMRRNYGSDVPNLLDSPANRFFAVDLYIAIAEALARWEPRIRLGRIGFKTQGDGKAELYLEAVYLPVGKPFLVEGLTVQ